MRVRLACTLVVPVVALSVTTDCAVTALLLTGKVTVVVPLGIRMLAGTLTCAGLELVSVTVVPPAGVGPVSVNVAELWAPPVIVVGERAKPETTGGTTEAAAVLDTDADDAVTVTSVDTATGTVLAANEAVAE